MGIYSSMDKSTYDKLTQIAPTVGPESTTTSTTWQDQTLITGKALGREEQAKKVVADRTEQISREQFGLLDQDLVVVIGTEQKVFSRDPPVRNLQAAKEGRIVYFGDFASEFSGAVGYGSLLSLPYALDLAVPRLSAALDDDPATRAN